MTPGAWRSVQVTGLAGVPSSGVGAVQVSVSALAPNSSPGTVALSQMLATPKPQTVLTYGYGEGATTNTAIVAVGSNGQIEAEASTGINLVVDVEGYYTSGDTAAGGFVAITPTRVVNTQNGTGLPKAQLAGGSTTSVQFGGVAGVPADASAVFVNVAVQDYASTAGYATVFAADQARPNVALDYPVNATTSFGSTVPLSTSGASAGAAKVYVSAGPVDVFIDVVGYFEGSATSGAFTPAMATVAKNVTIGATSTVAIPVAGVAGVPVAGAGISAVAMNLSAKTTTSSGGYLRAWASTKPQPNTGVLNLPHAAAVTSNFLASQVGTDGKINIYSSSPDPITVTLTVQGWYTNTGAAIGNGQDQTQQSVTLQADPKGGGPWVTYQYRLGATGSFANVPVANVKDGNGNAPSAWPVQNSGGGTPAFTAYTWNIRNTLAAIAANNGMAPDSLIQVQACYGTSSSDTNLACGMPSNVQFAQSAFGDGFATTDLGPGSLALLTGDYEISATDADAATSLGGLSIGRTLTTLAPVDAGLSGANQRPDASGVFGPGWTADLAGPDAGDADLEITDNGSYLLFTGTDLGVDTYQATSPTATYPVTFAAVGAAVGNGSTVTRTSATVITMTDDDGTVTTWQKSGSGWRVASVAQPGSNATATYSYNGSGLVTRILAPVPAGVSCASPDTTPGCRSLVLTYQSVTVGGSSVARLQNVALSLPQTAGTANSVTVAAYDYTSGGLLADAYDPRITPNLKTAYTYTAAGRLATLTPPGLAAFTFGYDASGRLATVSRPDPSGGAATQTIVYGVATNGPGLPDLRAQTAGNWGESTDLPVTGTAIFPASHQPGGSIGTTDWPYASIDYLDVNGEQVNTAAYGAGDWQLDTTQYDINGNVVWDLSAGNRAQALAPTSATDSYVASFTGDANRPTRAALLASSTVYNPLDPSQVSDTFGPTHPVTLAGGSSIDARSHVSTSYDDGAPNGGIDPATGAAYGLPTTVVSDPYNVATQADTSYPDASTTRTGYARSSPATPVAGICISRPARLCRWAPAPIRATT